ncbi:MAG: hypothetical protein JSR46_11490 [Verrucomicrobia bacterium]|nr:hypothetical protein [Verrucomicrobiota bacterium]
MHLEPPRKFFCQDDITPQNSYDFTYAVKGIGTELEGIVTAQKNIATYFESRNVSRKIITSQYSIWTEELAALSTRIQKCLTRIQTQWQQLPFLDEATCVYGFKELSTLEQRFFRLNEKNERLVLLIKSPEHQESFKLSKEIVKRCEAEKIPSLSLLNELVEKVEKLIEIQVERLEQVDPHLRNAIHAIHMDSVNFLSYVKNCVHSEESETENRLEKLLSKLAPPTQSTERKELTHPDSKYMNSFKEHVLPNERYFKNGIYKANWRYPEIWTHIEELHEIAKGLHQIETDVEERIKRVWQGETTSSPNYKTCLDVLKEGLTITKDRLYTIDFCTYAYSGLHYAAGLFCWIEEIQHQVAFLSKISSKPWQQVAQLHHVFCKYLQPCRSMSLSQRVYCDAAPIYNLYGIIKQLHVISQWQEGSPFFQKYKTAIDAVVGATLARTANTVLSLISEEKAIESNMMNESSTLLHNYHIKALLSKKIVTCLHFSNNRSDLLLDLLLALLETREGSIKYFKRMVGEDSDLAELITAYKTVSHFDQDAHTVALFVDILHLLKQTSTDALSTLFTCCQVLQRLFEAKEALVNKERWNFFLELIRDDVRKLTARCNFPDHYLHVDTIETDLSLLLKALWAKESDIQAQAQARVIENVSSFVQLPDTTTYLLKALALQTFLTSHEAPLSDLQTTYLPLLFSEYIEEPSIWHAQIGISTMEEALYSLLSNEHTSHLISHDSLNKWRSLPSFASDWKTTMTFYLSVKQKVTSEKKLVLQSSYQKDLKRLRKLCGKLQSEENSYAYTIFNALLVKIDSLLNLNTNRF